MAGQDLIKVHFALGEKNIGLRCIQVKFEFLGEHKVNEAFNIVINREIESTGLWCLAFRLKKDWDQAACLWGQRIEEKHL